MSADELLAHVQAAARHVDRNLQLVEQGLQSRDHPVHPAMPETSYLKMFFLRVLR
jgi:23S rRNA (cytosine1962-C5)-methyltransferase